MNLPFNEFWHLGYEVNPVECVCVWGGWSLFTCSLRILNFQTPLLSELSCSWQRTLRPINTNHFLLTVSFSTLLFFFWSLTTFIFIFFYVWNVFWSLQFHEMIILPWKCAICTWKVRVMHFLPKPTILKVFLCGYFEILPRRDSVLSVSLLSLIVWTDIHVCNLWECDSLKLWLY